MSRPPPNLTPLPYTTLFRSLGPQRLLCPRGQHRPRPLVERPHRVDGDIDAALLVASRRQVADKHDIGQADRKSTRLNSSHANISYAVFCLKIKQAFPLLPIF